MTSAVHQIVDPSSAGTPLPARALSTVEIAEAAARAVATVIVEHMKPVETGTPRAQRRNLPIIVAMAVIVLLAGTVLYLLHASDRDSQARHRAAQAEQSAKATGTIIEEIRTLTGAVTKNSGSLSELQGAMNTLYCIVIPEKCRPKSLAPLSDAVSHGSNIPP